MNVNNMNMDPNIRKFIASSELFSGFEVYIDLNYCNSLDDIVNTFYDDLHNFLNSHNLVVLVNKVKLCRFHIHGFTIEDILLSDKDVEELSKLPSRQVLLGMAVNVIASPLTSLATSLQQIITKLPWALNAIKEKKEKQ